MAEYSLLELASRLAADPTEKAVYQSDPPGYLDARGYGELSPGELRDALGHVADTVPPELAAVIDPSAGLDQLAAADLHELGLEELHGVPVASPPEELTPESVDTLDADPGALDALDAGDAAPLGAAQATSVDRADDAAEDLPDDGAGDGADEVDGTGRDVTGIGAEEADDAAASGFGAPEDPFGELDGDLDGLGGLDPEAEEPVESGLDEPGTPWDDFDV